MLWQIGRQLHISQRAFGVRTSALLKPSMSYRRLTVRGFSSSTSSPTPEKKSLWQRVKDEVEHYWLGTKLLGKETSISTRLLWKMSKGISLTRREHHQLVRTAKDLFRLVPFSIFVIVPFMELLLPVALKLFPNMLPSTYTSQEKEEADRRKIMASKLQLAKFLRDSVAEAGLSSTPHAAKAQEFTTFFKKYRSTGERASTNEVFEICKKFSGDFTLENLSRPQIVTLCRFMGVNAFGTDNFLRYILRNRMQEIKNDDKMILIEGVDSLDLNELISACQIRAIRTIGYSPNRLRYELQQWLDLHTKYDVPPILIVLSRALMMTDKPAKSADTAEALQATLTSLPNEIVEEAELRLSEAEGKMSFKKKLDIIEKEEKKIAEELKLSDAKKAKDKEMEQQELASDFAEDDKQELSKSQLKDLGHTLQVLSETQTEPERNELRELKEDRERFMQEEIVTGVAPSKTKLKQLKELDELILEIEEYLELMDSQRETISAAITSNLQDKITTEQLEAALKSIRHPPNEDRIKNIVKRLDKDGDGRVFLEEILELGKEDEPPTKQ